MKRFFSDALKIAAGIVIGSTMTVFASQLISNVYLNQELKISINGKVQTLTDATTGAREYPLTYRDRTYLPLRSIATLLGYKVGYDATSNTATVDSPDYVAPTPTPTPTPKPEIPLESVNLSDIEIVKELDWQDGPITDSLSLFNYNYVISNVVNSLYMRPESADLDKLVHPGSPLRPNMEKALRDIVDVQAKYSSLGGFVNLYCTSDTVKFEKFGYNSDGRCMGCLVSYDIETSVTYNGETNKDIQTYTSVFILRDENSSDICWVADIAK